MSILGVNRHVVWLSAISWPTNRPSCCCPDAGGCRAISTTSSSWWPPWRGVRLPLGVMTFGLCFISSSWWCCSSTASSATRRSAPPSTGLTGRSIASWCPTAWSPTFFELTFDLGCVVVLLDARAACNKCCCQSPVVFLRFYRHDLLVLSIKHQIDLWPWWWHVFVGAAARDWWISTAVLRLCISFTPDPLVDLWPLTVMTRAVAISSTLINRIKSYGRWMIFHSKTWIN